jgi:putative hydrolase of the HAD superfamily
MTPLVTSVTAVWTDFGGVLTPPISHTFMTFCASMDLDPGQLMDAVLTVTAGFGTGDIMEPIDTPLVSEEEWLARISAVMRERHGVDRRMTTLADAWFDNRETNKDWLRVLFDLKDEGLFVGLLSNMVPSWDAHWRRMVPPDRIFDAVLLSFQVGHRKPSQEIFEMAASAAGAAPEQCVLVDDNEANCAGARACGWHAIHFTSTTDAVTALTQLLALGENHDGKALR